MSLHNDDSKKLSGLLAALVIWNAEATAATGLLNSRLHIRTLVTCHVCKSRFTQCAQTASRLHRLPFDHLISHSFRIMSQLHRTSTTQECPVGTFLCSHRASSSSERERGSTFWTLQLHNYFKRLSSPLCAQYRTRSQLANCCVTSCAFSVCHVEDVMIFRP